ncbi:MAG: hypothetical protein QW367_00750 [Candidatus Aenigmatarchaeota archaeon]
MINKRFQKFLFLLVITFLSFTILPAFSDINDKNIFSAVYYLGILSGVICIIVGIFGLIKNVVKHGILAIVVGSILIGISSYMPPVLIEMGHLNFIALGFMVVIYSGALYFLGYVFVKSRAAQYSKYFFDASAIVAFFGIFIIELIIFSVYISVSKFPLEECKGEINFLETKNFFFCIFLGKKLVGEQSLWMWLSFLIFGIILPFSVVFSMTFGLFFGMGLDKMFGPYGKPVVSIIAFATAMFGMRQLIGPFLIDLLAYGVWGIFGVMIAFIVASAIRFIGMRFLEDVEHIKQSIYGEFRISVFSKLNYIKESLKEISGTVSDTSTPKGALEEAKTIVQNIITVLEGYLKDRDPEISVYASSLLAIAKNLQQEIEKRLQEQQKSS